MIIWNVFVGYIFSSMCISWLGFFKIVVYDIVIIWVENNEYRRRVVVGKFGLVVLGDLLFEVIVVELN